MCYCCLLKLTKSDEIIPGVVTISIFMKTCLKFLDAISLNLSTKATTINKV